MRAPESRSIACSALWARCVRPSFIFVTFASGSDGLLQSLFDVLLRRRRSSLASAARVGVLIPDSSASRVRNMSYLSPVSRAEPAGTVLRSLDAEWPRGLRGVPQPLPRLNVLLEARRTRARLRAKPRRWEGRFNERTGSANYAAYLPVR